MISVPAGLRYRKPPPARARLIPGRCGSLRTSPGTAAAGDGPSKLMTTERMRRSAPGGSSGLLTGRPPGPGPARTAAGRALNFPARRGTLCSGWKALSVHAGPVWFIYARPRGTASSGHRLSVGKVAGSAMVIAVENGHTAVVSAAPQARGRFRFLAGFNPDGKPYTLAGGAPGLTLASCPPVPAGTGIPEAYAPGLTMFWEGYVTALRGCIPLEVRSPAASTPTRVTVAVPAAAASHGC